ncbi:hypothetical protein K438DRAFT_1762232 [Mycena galopus ATCC 62051]|nr:hypothetical protein K438DRAFT_1762232 [Mycena galopus ATCC 62051]
MVRLGTSIRFLIVLCGIGEALTSSTADTALSPLPDFVHEVFAQLTSTNDTVSQAALNNFYSPDFLGSDVASTTNLTRADFGEVVQGLRAQLSQRQLIGETFAVATPADPTNRTGALAATHVLSAVQDGQQVVATIVSLLRIEWIQDEAYDQGGRREISWEKTVLPAGTSLLKAGHQHMTASSLDVAASYASPLPPSELPPTYNLIANNE